MPETNAARSPGLGEAEDRGRPLDFDGMVSGPSDTTPNVGLESESTVRRKPGPTALPASAKRQAATRTDAKPDEIGGSTLEA